MSSVKGVDTVVRMMVSVGEGARAMLMETMNAVAIDVTAYVKASKLSGQALNRRTGNLSRSVHPEVRQGTSSVSAVVGTNLAYAAAHEYGIQRNVVVSAHFRMQTLVFGRKMKAPREVLVNQHSSYMNLPERSFLRSGLADKKDDEVKRVRDAMTAFIEDATR